jgi:hypothetical protein
MLTIVPPPVAIIAGRQAGAQERAVDDDAGDVPPLREADLGERRLLPVGGVVDKDVELAEARERRVDHRLDRRLVGDADEMDSACPPRASISAATASASSFEFLALITTAAPSSASASAIARLIRRTAPVTRATCASGSVPRASTMGPAPAFFSA